MNYRRIAISTIAIASLGLAACGDDTVTPAEQPIEVTTSETAAAPTTEAAAPTSDAAAPATSEAAPAETTADQNTAGAADPSSALAAITQAIELAEQEAGGTAYQIDDENFDREWEIDVWIDGTNTVEVTVDAEGATVVDSREDSDDDVPAMPSTTIVEAITAAADHTPGVLDGAELDEEDGVVVWKVDLDETEQGDDVEIHLDTTTLEVLKVD